MSLWKRVLDGAGPGSRVRRRGIASAGLDHRWAQFISSMGQGNCVSVERHNSFKSVASFSPQCILSAPLHELPSDDWLQSGAKLAIGRFRSVDRSVCRKDVILHADVAIAKQWRLPGSAKWSPQFFSRVVGRHVIPGVGSDAGSPYSDDVITTKKRTCKRSNSRK